jgi:hypothetical protein
MDLPLSRALNGQDQNMTKSSANPRLCVVESAHWPSEARLIANLGLFAIPKMMPMLFFVVLVLKRPYRCA